MPIKKPVKKSVPKKQVGNTKKTEPKVAAAKKSDKKVVKTAEKKVAIKKVAEKAIVKTEKKATVSPAKKSSIVKAPAKPAAATAPKTTAAPKKYVVPKAPPKPTTIKKPVRKETPLKEVKVPKTSVVTKVEYKPEYKSMEQRTYREDKKQASIPLVRYSDSELNEFRDLIQKKLDLAKRELSYLQGLITRKDDMGGDESENRYMTMEDGSISMEREQLSQMASRQITYIDHLEKALIRIENKTYGICRVTGKLIDKNRLRAVPHATLSLEAKLGLVKGGE
jgi:RNA polymerase-binding transcription factor DksA